MEGLDRVSGLTSRGTLTLCDLAGSERISKTEAEGQRLVEAAAINKSLTALGQVQTQRAHLAQVKSCDLVSENVCSVLIVLKQACVIHISDDLTSSKVAVVSPPGVQRSEVQRAPHPVQELQTHPPPAALPQRRCKGQHHFLSFTR